jgi:hypothetical protein
MRRRADCPSLAFAAGKEGYAGQQRRPLAALQWRRVPSSRPAIGRYAGCQPPVRHCEAAIGAAGLVGFLSDATWRSRNTLRGGGPSCAFDFAFPGRTSIACGYCPWLQVIVEGMLRGDLSRFNCLAIGALSRGASKDLNMAVSASSFQRQPITVSIPIGAEPIHHRHSTPRNWPACAAGRELGLEARPSGSASTGSRPAGIPSAWPDRTGAGAPARLIIRFVFMRSASVARGPGYAEISAEIENQIAQVNERYGHGADDGPIKYLKQSFPLPELVALYRLANFCIVSSLHDGMNLVAKEFVAARDDHDGVLILSELAGAAQELAEALIINPYDEQGFTAAVERAIEMPAWERRRRMQAMRRRVAGRDVLVWASDILDRLERRKGPGFLAG